VLKPNALTSNESGSEKTKLDQCTLKVGHRRVTRWKWVGSHRRKVSAATVWRKTATEGVPPPLVDGESVLPPLLTISGTVAGVRDVIGDMIGPQMSRDSSSSSAGELCGGVASDVGVASPLEPELVGVGTSADHAEWPEMEIWRREVLGGRSTGVVVSDSSAYGRLSSSRNSVGLGGDRVTTCDSRSSWIQMERLGIGVLQEDVPRKRETRKQRTSASSSSPRSSAAMFSCSSCSVTSSSRIGLYSHIGRHRLIFQPWSWSVVTECLAHISGIRKVVQEDASTRVTSAASAGVFLDAALKNERSERLRVCMFCIQQQQEAKVIWQRLHRRIHCKRRTVAVTEIYGRSQKLKVAHVTPSRTTMWLTFAWNSLGPLPSIATQNFKSVALAVLEIRRGSQNLNVGHVTPLSVGD